MNSGDNMDMDDMLSDLYKFKCGVPNCPGMIDPEIMRCPECLIKYTENGVVPAVIISRRRKKKRPWEFIDE